MYVCIYIYIYTYTYKSLSLSLSLFMYIYIYIDRERYDNRIVEVEGRRRGHDRGRHGAGALRDPQGLL